jgi:hypothetical protein
LDAESMQRLRRALWSYLEEVPSDQPKAFLAVAWLLRATAALGLAMLALVLGLEAGQILSLPRALFGGDSKWSYILLPTLVLVMTLAWLLVGSWVLSSAFAKWAARDPKGRHDVAWIGVLLLWFGGAGIVSVWRGGAAARGISPSVAVQVLLDAVLLGIGIAILVLLSRPGTKAPFRSPRVPP